MGHLSLLSKSWIDYCITTKLKGPIKLSRLIHNIADVFFLLWQFLLGIKIIEYGPDIQFPTSNILAVFESGFFLHWVNWLQKKDQVPVQNINRKCVLGSFSFIREQYSYLFWSGPNYAKYSAPYHWPILLWTLRVRKMSWKKPPSSQFLWRLLDWNVPEKLWWKEKQLEVQNLFSI